MAITVKHTKVSTIPDGDDTSLVRPSDWNADHQLTGTIPVDNGGTGASTLTGYVKGNGTAAMTASATVPSTDITGLGTMSTQNANNVAVTGGTVSNTTLTSDTVSNNLNFTPTTAPTYLEGRVWYDSTEKALAFYNDSSALAVHVSQDLIFKVINNTGSTIPNGSPVYITGTSSGQTYPNVALAKADVAATSSVIGLTNGAIANGAIGYVSSQGTIDNVNTSTFTVGQILYLSPYSAGQLMNTVPPTGITVQVGVATYIDSTAGHIYVKQTTPLAVPASIITGQVAIANGGTGQATQQTAINALTGTQSSGKYLRSDGTNATLTTIQAADVPTLNQNTTGSAATLTTGRTIAITGDLDYTSPSFDGSTNVTAAGTLATVNSNVGTFTKITVNGKGLTTAASQASLTDLSSPTASFSFGSQKLTNLLDPTAAQDGATKSYVDNIAQGLNVKSAVLAATTASITLVGGQTIDGVTVVAGDRVLVKNQSVSSANGIYNVQTTVWTRTTDADTWNELVSAFVFVEQGTTQADTGWVCTVDPGGTLGVTAVTFTQFSGAGTYTAGTGLTLTGNQFAIDSTVATLSGSQTLTNKTISGSSNTLSNIGNSSLTNSAITINGTSTSLGGSISVGTVTSVTGTSPVVSSGGATPAISMPAATTSVSGYLTSTDWNTFNNKGNGTVTSVTGTAPVVSSGGATPAISMAAATTSVNGYLTSTDWTTFNNKYSVGGALGTPSSATLTNATGLPLTTGVTGTLPIANGGTNSTATATAGGVGYGTGTAHAYTSAGTTGQVLTSNGASAPTWSNPSGGAIIQLVQSTYSTQTSNSTTTFADSGLTGTITPTSASSKVLITITGAMYKSNGNQYNSLSLKIQKNGSNLLTFADLQIYTATATENAGMFVINYLDSPATTSATTYKLQFANSFVNASNVVVQFNNNPSTITLTEVA